LAPSPISHVSPRLFSTRPTSSTPLYPLSLHDALPISFQHIVAAGRGHRGALTHERRRLHRDSDSGETGAVGTLHGPFERGGRRRSEEHTSELQSRFDLVCRLLLEKKKRQ